jgi:hypothetical protein
MVSKAFGSCGGASSSQRPHCCDALTKKIGSRDETSNVPNRELNHDLRNFSFQNQIFCSPLDHETVVFLA